MGWWVSAESCLAGGLGGSAVLLHSQSAPGGDGGLALVEDSGQDSKDFHSVPRWHLVSPVWVDVTTAQENNLLTRLHASRASLCNATYFRNHLTMPGIQ